MSPFLGLAGNPFSSVSISTGSVCFGFAGVVEAVVYCGSAVTFGRSVRTVCSGVVTALLVETVTAGLDVVDLVMSIEDEFEMEVPDEEIEKMKTVADVVKFIEDNQ